MLAIAVDRECFIKVQSNRQRLHRLWRERVRLYVIGFIGNLLSSRLASNRWLQPGDDFLRLYGKLIFNSRQYKKRKKGHNKVFFLEIEKTDKVHNIEKNTYTHTYIYVYIAHQVKCVYIHIYN